MLSINIVYNLGRYIVYNFANCSVDIHNILHRTLDDLNIKYVFQTYKKNNKSVKHSQAYYTNINHKNDVIFLDSFIGYKH